jgi:hypothetical protein
MTLDYLTELYRTDPEFVSVYHGNTGWSAAQCASDSWENIKDLELHKTDYGYIAVNRNDLIDRLAGFFIKPEHRNAQTKDRFFKDLYKLMPNNFLATLHSSNIKAIKFLCLKGNITMNDKITTYIVFRQEYI